jgi:hypothetical protein
MSGYIEKCSISRRPQMTYIRLVGGLKNQKACRQKNMVGVTENRVWSLEWEDRTRRHYPIRRMAEY